MEQIISKTSIQVSSFWNIRLQHFICGSLVCLIMLCLCCPIAKAQNLEEYTKENGYNISELTIANKKFYGVTKNHVNGLLDDKGNIVIPIKYRSIRYDENYGFYEVCNEDLLYGIYSAEGRVVLPCLYSGILASKAENGNYYFVIDNKNDNYKGIFDSNGKEIIPANKYTHFEPFRNGFVAHVGSIHGYVALIDWNGKIIIPANKYTKIKRYKENLNVVIRDNHAGVCDDTGKELFFTRYNDLWLEQTKDGKCYFGTRIGPAKGKIDLKGNVIEEVKPYIHKEPQKKGDFEYVEVYDTLGNVGIEVNNRMIIPCAYEQILYSSYDNIFNLKKNGTEGVASREGSIIIPTGHYHAIYWNKKENHYRVEYKGTEGLCLPDGKEIIAAGKYSHVSKWKDSPYDDLFFVREGNYCGIVNKENNVIVPIRYTNILHGQLLKEQKYSDRLDVYLHKKRGVCDYEGNEIIPPIYDGVYESAIKKDYKEHMYSVKNGDKAGLINGNGNVIIPADYFERVTIVFDTQGKHYIYAQVGNRKCDLDFNGNIMRDNEKDNQRDELYDLGDKKFEKKDYKTAMQYYKKASDIRKSAGLSYNIALCYYNTDDYKQSIRYLDECLSLNPSDWVRDHATDVKNKCYYYSEQAKIQRRQNIMSAMYGLFNIGASVYQMTQMQKQRNTNREKVYTGITSGDNDYASEGNDYENSSNTRSTNSGKVCRTCHGDGKCLSCHGEGIRTDNSFGTGKDARYKCGVCGGDGICNICKGSGRQ